MLNSTKFESEENDIDFQIFFKIILYYKNLIFKAVILGFIVGIISSLTSKRIWEGQFQIVLNSDENSSKSITLPPFAKNFGSFNTSNNIFTEGRNCLFHEVFP